MLCHNNKTVQFYVIFEEVLIKFSILEKNGGTVFTSEECMEIYYSLRV